MADACRCFSLRTEAQKRQIKKVVGLKEKVPFCLLGTWSWDIYSLRTLILNIRYVGSHAYQSEREENTFLSNETGEICEWVKSRWTSVVVVVRIDMSNDQSVDFESNHEAENYLLAHV